MMTGQPTGALDALRRAVEDLLLRVETRLNLMRRRAGDEATARAQAAAEATGNAASVPREVIDDARAALTAWSRSALAMLGILLAALVLGTVILVLVTMGLVVALNALLGDPWGTLAVAFLYLVAAALVIALLARAARRSNEEAKAAVEHATEDAARGVEGRPPRHPRAQA